MYVLAYAPSFSTISILPRNYLLSPENICVAEANNTRKKFVLPSRLAWRAFDSQKRLLSFAFVSLCLRDSVAKTAVYAIDGDARAYRAHDNVRETFTC